MTGVPSAIVATVGRLILRTAARPLRLLPSCPLNLVNGTPILGDCTAAGGLFLGTHCLGTARLTRRMLQPQG